MKKYESGTLKETGEKSNSSIDLMLLLIFLLIILGHAFSGCTTHLADPIRLFSGGGKDYGNTIPGTVKLSNYKAIQVNATSSFYQSEDQCVKLKDKIIEFLKKERLFERVLREADSQEPPADLQLNVEIIALKKVNALERMTMDEYVGKSMLMVVNRLKDVKTGEELGSFTAGAESASGGWAENFAVGTTNQAVKLTAKQIVKFIKSHM